MVKGSTTKKPQMPQLSIMVQASLLQLFLSQPPPLFFVDLWQHIFTTAGCTVFAIPENEDKKTTQATSKNAKNFIGPNVLRNQYR